MRTPHLSARAVAAGDAFRALVRPVLLEHIGPVAGLDEYLRELVTGVADLEAGPPPGLDPEALVELRVKVARALGAPDP
eukprot:4038989-Alexandrium_andersonii.AAC.1